MQCCFFLGIYSRNTPLVFMELRFVFGPRHTTLSVLFLSKNPIDMQRNRSSKYTGSQPSVL